MLMNHKNLDFLRSALPNLVFIVPHSLPLQSVSSLTLAAKRVWWTGRDMAQKSSSMSLTSCSSEPLMPGTMEEMQSELFGVGALSNQHLCLLQTHGFYVHRTRHAHPSLINVQHCCQVCSDCVVILFLAI